MRRLAAMLAAMGGLVGGAVAAGAADQPMDDLRVGSSRASVDATPGSGCFSRENGDGTATGGCADFPYPLTVRGELLVRRGHEVAFDFDHPVAEVAAPPFALRPASGRAPALRWLGTVPDGLGHETLRLDVNARFDPAANPTGERNFQLAIRALRPRHARVRVPKVLGLGYISAARRLESRGLRWRLGRDRQVHFDSGPPPDPSVRATPDFKVLRQSLRPGRRVRRGTVLRLETFCTLAAARDEHCD